jgi:pimeloyl-ACP methyl ester carboxylesterase
VPAKLANPAPVGIHLHCWGGNLTSGYGWWFNAEKGSILLASNEVPYDWWTGYHELKWSGPKSKAAWQKGMVRPYSQRRMLSFLDWMAKKWKVDLARTFVAGSSMGGSGAPMLAIRYPERIAWCISWVGVHTPAESPTFKNSYANSYGEPEWQVKFEDGTPVWDHFDDTWYLRQYPEKEIGLITFSNGKNDNAIGWPQAAEFHRALQETKRPHVFVWGQAGHGQRATMPVSLGERVLPIDVRIDQTLPAFTHCSLDDDPGDGDPDHGDAKGQSNLYLYWETADIVERASLWEMTVGLIAKAPKNDGTVDITPRRCQQFRAKPGARLKWTNSVDGKALQRGEATADEHGLVTLEKVRVTKAKHRIRIER